MKSRVFVVERHAALQRAVAALIANEADFEISGVTGRGGEALSLILEQRPDIVIIDFALPDNAGLELAQAIRKQLPKVALIAFSLGEEADLALNALRVGALAFVSKAEKPASLLAAIRNIRAAQLRAGDAAVRASLSDVVEQVRQRDGGPGQKGLLSDSEHGLMALIAEGWATPEIAAMLGLSVHGVKKVRASLKRKLRCATAVDLVRMCVLATKHDSTLSTGNSPRARRLQDQLAELTKAVARIEAMREDMVHRRHGAADHVMLELDERLEVNGRTLVALRRTLSVTRLELEIELRAAGSEQVLK